MTSLEEIKRMLAAATPRPWVMGDPEEPEWVCADGWFVACMVNPNEPDDLSHSPTATPEAIKANAQLIVAAVNEIGGIIEQVERLQKVADAAEAVCGDAVADSVDPDVFCAVGTPEIKALRHALEETK